MTCLPAGQSTPEYIVQKAVQVHKGDDFVKISPGVYNINVSEREKGEGPEIINNDPHISIRDIMMK